MTVIPSDPETTPPVNPLSAFRGVEIFLNAALDLIRGAEGMAKDAGIDDWFATHIGGHVEAFDNEIMPELRAAIEQLEAEIRP
jgi:hypothetical protein